MFPFSAIVGQEDAKLALLLTSIDPGIGGVLLTGVKGTGKSTIVRAIAGVLPQIKIVSDCPYNCPPDSPNEMCDECLRRLSSGEEMASRSKQTAVVTVPLGTSEDRLLGTVNVERLLSTGDVRFEPGLLAQANRQVLYIDEVNLLPDNITDDILDAAVSGVNLVEREGVSVRHPARFTLVGTMNPEEGQLRPQILDRFALSVKIETIKSPELRAEIVKRAMAHSVMREKFEKTFAKVDGILRERIECAKERIGDVKIPFWVLTAVSSAMAKLGVDGQRPDIVSIRSAVAYAALEGDRQVDTRHIEKVTPLAVCHRTRNGGFDPPPEKSEVLDAMRQTTEAAKKGASGSEIMTLNSLAQYAIEQAMAAIEQTSEELKKND